MQTQNNRRICYNYITAHLPLAFVGGTILWGSVATRRLLFLGDSAAFGMGGPGSWGSTIRDDVMQDVEVSGEIMQKVFRCTHVK